MNLNNKSTIKVNKLQKEYLPFKKNLKKNIIKKIKKTL